MFVGAGGLKIFPEASERRYHAEDYPGYPDFHGGDKGRGMNDIDCRMQESHVYCGLSFSSLMGATWLAISQSDKLRSMPVMPSSTCKQKILCVFFQK